MDGATSIDLLIARARRSVRTAWFFALVLTSLFCLFLPARAQESPANSIPDAPAAQSQPGTLQGTVVDSSGAVVPSAYVRLALASSENIDLIGLSSLTSDDGSFSFASLPAGTYHLTITASGFESQEKDIQIRPGEISNLGQLAMPVAIADTNVEVSGAQVEIAQQQIKVQEQQRILGAIPNFYVSYDPNAVPLDSRQKFQLAWKTIIDPVNTGINGVVAGIQQWQNYFAGYGQGASGYFKRFGASEADFINGTLIGGAILPSLLRQDPRYFYKGTGTKKSRFFYAIANAVICKGDNGHWQPNYSSIGGSLAAGGISNLYYPDAEKGDVALTFENTAIGIGTTAAVNIVQEFFLKKVTPKAKDSPPKP
jgi:hypothetical protein